jgi:excisionase family DNA binding protein
LLDISHKTLYRLMNSGELQSFVVGRSRRIPMASIRAYIEARIEKFPKPKPRRASG